MKIGILGGTFDPPHNGHLALAQAAMDVLELDEVIFVPARRNPLKRGDRAIPAKHRLEMLRLALADRKGFALSTDDALTDPALPVRAFLNSSGG